MTVRPGGTPAFATEPSGVPLHDVCGEDEGLCMRTLGVNHGDPVQAVVLPFASLRNEHVSAVRCRYAAWAFGIRTPTAYAVCARLRSDPAAAGSSGTSTRNSGAGTSSSGAAVLLRFVVAVQVRKGVVALLVGLAALLVRVAVALVWQALGRAVVARAS